MTAIPPFSASAIGPAQSVAPGANPASAPAISSLRAFASFIGDDPLRPVMPGMMDGAETGKFAGLEGFAPTVPSVIAMPAPTPSLLPPATSALSPYPGAVADETADALPLTGALPTANTPAPPTASVAPALTPSAGDAAASSSQPLPVPSMSASAGQDLSGRDAAATDDSAPSPPTDLVPTDPKRVADSSPKEAAAPGVPAKSAVPAASSHVVTAAMPLQQAPTPSVALAVPTQPAVDAEPLVTRDSDMGSSAADSEDSRPARSPESVMTSGGQQPIVALPVTPAATLAVPMPVAPADGQRTIAGEGSSNTSTMASAPASDAPAPVTKAAHQPSADVRPAIVSLDAAAADTTPAFADHLAATPGAPTPARETAAANSMAVPASISSRPGEAGHALGIAIARQQRDGIDEISLRLDPGDLGKVHVKLHFEDGMLRAHVRTESYAALDLMRREANDLNRALADAGVRTDGGSFRFEGGAQQQHGREQNPARQQAVQDRYAVQGSDGAVDDNPVYHRVRSSGRLDVFA